MNSVQRVTTRLPEGLERQKIVLRQSSPAPVDFTAAGLVQTIFLFGLPANHVIVGVRALLVTPFVAPGMSSCNVILGSTDSLNGSITNTNFYMPAFTVTQSNPPSTVTGYPNSFEYNGNSSLYGFVMYQNPNTYNDPVPGLSQVQNYYAGWTATVISGFGGGTAPIIAYDGSTGVFWIPFNDFNNTFVVNASSLVAITPPIATGPNISAAFSYWSPFAMYTTDPQDIKAQFTSVGANLNTITAGEVEFTVMYRSL